MGAIQMVVDEQADLRLDQPQKIVQCNAMISIDRRRYSIQFRVVCISKLRIIILIR